MSFKNSKINLVTNDIYYGKKDIMRIFNCESDKALKILKVIFQMKEGVKIGREYYVGKHTLDEFMEDMKGKAIHI